MTPKMRLLDILFVKALAPSDIFLKKGISLMKSAQIIATVPFKADDIELQGSTIINLLKQIVLKQIIFIWDHKWTKNVIYKLKYWKYLQTSECHRINRRRRDQEDHWNCQDNPWHNRPEFDPFFLQDRESWDHIQRTLQTLLNRIETADK